MRGYLLACLVASYVGSSAAFSVQPASRIPVSQKHQLRTTANTRLFAAEKDEKDGMDRKSFNEAGRSIVEQEDQDDLDELNGMEYDSNEAYTTDRTTELRAAIKARAANLNLEESKVTADYIAAKTKAAQEAGSARVLDESNDSFGGLDLSKINSEKVGGSDWDEDMPNMFYEPEEDMTEAEQEEADPLGTKSVIEQATTEIAAATWPTPMAALREVGLMIVVVAITAVMIIYWDKFIRALYMDIGFIPTADEMASYASRFDGLDLPDGWMDNMNEEDIAAISDTLGGL